jgi:2-succinyl-5-enolpyruvyl-6-hydroxy-3-cyclohexene-1-carboxylate synthase
MTDLPLNRIWSRAVLRRLVACGVGDVVLCLGGRSTALAIEAAAMPEIRMILRVDERGAAFFALGLARAGGRPVAIVTTSGSAVANTIPAMAEAWSSGAALILISCDRPEAARAAGAPQTLAHLPLSASVTAAQDELPEPLADKGALADAVIRLDRLFGIARDRNQPVHLNLPMRGEISSVQADDPLVALDILPPDIDLPLARKRRRTDGPGAVDAWVDTNGVAPGQRGVIAVGPHTEMDAPALAALSAKTGFPLIVDAGSGLRGALPGCLTLADILVFHPIVAQFTPRVVLHAGKPMTSPYLERWLNAEGVQRFALDHVRMRGPSRAVPRPPLSQGGLRRLAERLGPGDTTWGAQLTEIDRAALARAPASVAASGWNEATAAYHALHAPGFARVFFASSLAVRMGNLWAGADPAQKVDVNRGLNGIDGTLSSFFGTLSAAGERGLLIVGDQAFLHDLPGLERLAVPVHGVILLLDNAGPGLLDLVVWNGAPQVRAALHQATQMDVAGIAQGFGLGYAQVSDADGLIEAIDAAPDDAITLVHARLPDTGLEAAVATLVRALLGAGP